MDLTPLPPVTCYAAKINQVVMNLLTNAIDACPEGGTVTVRTRPEDGGVRIEVADTGCGIDPDVRDRIFDPFFTTKPVGQGTGLGLSISYGIIKDHGGTIDVDSTPGQGACFIVHLPLRPSPKTAQRGGEPARGSRITRTARRRPELSRPTNPERIGGSRSWMHGFIRHRRLSPSATSRGWHLC